MMRDKIFIIRDINVYNFECNPYFLYNINTRSIKKLIENLELSFNNNNNFSIYPSSSNITIIDLAIRNQDLNIFYVLKIPEEYLFQSDHKIIMIK